MKYNKTNISDAVIRRLPMYYRHLVKLLDNQTLRVSSKQLADIMNVTASQIRQDLNHFGSFGQQGYGYDVVQLKEEIVAILGIHEKRKMIIIGAGNIGQALAKFAFETFNFEIVAIFDQNKELIGKSIATLTVKDISQLENYLEENQIDIAALTISNENVEPFSDRLTNILVKGIWNFTDIELSVPEDIAVVNVHLVDSLLQLAYKTSDYDI